MGTYIVVGILIIIVAGGAHSAAAADRGAGLYGTDLCRQ